MTLKKAIELAIDAERSLRSHEFTDHADAILLLIEAGKMIKEGRDKPGGMFFHDLPGETNE